MTLENLRIANDLMRELGRCNEDKKLFEDIISEPINGRFFANSYDDGILLSKYLTVDDIRDIETLIQLRIDEKIDRIQTAFDNI